MEVRDVSYDKTREVISLREGDFPNKHSLFQASVDYAGASLFGCPVT